MRIIDFAGKVPGLLPAAYTEQQVWFIGPQLEVGSPSGCSNGLRLRDGISILLNQPAESVELSICTGNAGRIHSFDTAGQLLRSYPAGAASGHMIIQVLDAGFIRLTFQDFANESALYRVTVRD